MTEEHPLAMEMIAEPETDALTLAWRTEQEIVRLKRRVAKLEEERVLLIDEAREAGRTEVDLGHGIVRLVVSPGTRTRVLDVDAFRTNYPKEFRNAATFTVKLADAERVLGTERLGELCTMRTSAERVDVVFEPTFDPAAREVTEA